MCVLSWNFDLLSFRTPLTIAVIRYVLLLVFFPFRRSSVVAVVFLRRRDTPCRRRQNDIQNNGNEIKELPITFSAHQTRTHPPTQRGTHERQTSTGPICVRPRNYVICAENMLSRCETVLHTETKPVVVVVGVRMFVVCVGACVRPCVVITLNCICPDYCWILM